MRLHSSATISARFSMLCKVNLNLYPVSTLNRSTANISVRLCIHTISGQLRELSTSWTHTWTPTIPALAPSAPEHPGLQPPTYLAGWPRRSQLAGCGAHTWLSTSSCSFGTTLRSLADVVDTAVVETAVTLAVSRTTTEMGFLRNSDRSLR